MKKILTSLILLGFILWILPLGYFIKPSMEKLACDGQRAMCMCRCMLGHRSVDRAMEAGVVLKTGSSSNKENSSGGSSNYFVSAKSAAVLNVHAVSVFENQFLTYKNPFLASIEYVPKI
jgi:hypothetical protein